MLRSRIIAICATLLITIGISVAQESADIVVGGEVVARVREKGPYESVQHRAQAIDEAINEAIAGAEDAAAIEVTLEQIDGQWTVLMDGKKVMAVYPAEAEANGMAPEVLGAIWVRKLKDALPNAAAVEVQEIGTPTTGTAPTPAPVAVAEEPTTAPTSTASSTPSPAPAISDEPATGAVTNTGVPAIEILEVPTETSEPDTIIAGQGARLLILKAFNDARSLAEDDYLVRREEMADELFDELVQLLTGGRAHGQISSETPTTPREPTTPEPAPVTTTAPPTTAPPPVSVSPGPVTELVSTTETVITPPVATSYELSEDGRAKIEAAIPENDPSYAKVVQKVVIKAKFRAAGEAYRTVLSSDPDAAAQAREILGAARSAFTDGDYDLTESYLDAALRTLGVTEWEQYIDAAMAELGLK